MPAAMPLDAPLPMRSQRAYAIDHHVFFFFFFSCLRRVRSRLLDDTPRVMLVTMLVYASL